MDIKMMSLLKNMIPVENFNLIYSSYFRYIIMNIQHRDLKPKKLDS